MEVLEEQAVDRVQELVPIRYGRMLVSPFTFYRGAAAIMAADLGATPHTGIRAQLCGDAHLSNFGGFAAPDRGLIFDINDFDETLPGPWEWDVMRLVASIEIAGRDRDFGRKQRALAVQSAAHEYREQMRRLAKLGNLDAWYERVNLDLLRTRFAGEVDSEAIALFDKNVAKAKRKDSARAFQKLTEIVDGRLRIRSDPPLITPFDELYGAEELARSEAEIRRMFGEYKGSLSRGLRHMLDRYTYVHAARKVVGVGSVGTRAWIVLFIGRDQGDPLFLQLKEATALGARAVHAQERVRTAGPPRRRGSADDAGRRRHPARLDAGPRIRRSDQGLLRASTLGCEGLCADRSDGTADDGRLRATLRRRAGERSRALRRSNRDRLLPRWRREVRPGDG